MAAQRLARLTAWLLLVHTLGIGLYVSTGWGTELYFSQQSAFTMAFGVHFGETIPLIPQIMASGGPGVIGRWIPVLAVFGQVAMAIQLLRQDLRGASLLAIGQLVLYVVAVGLAMPQYGAHSWSLRGRWWADWWANELNVLLWPVSVATIVVAARGLEQERHVRLPQWPRTVTVVSLMVFGIASLAPSPTNPGSIELLMHWVALWVIEIPRVPPAVLAILLILAGLCLIFSGQLARLVLVSGFAVALSLAGILAWDQWAWGQPVPDILTHLAWGLTYLPLFLLLYGFSRTWDRVKLADGRGFEVITAAPAPVAPLGPDSVDGRRAG